MFKPFSQDEYNLIPRTAKGKIIKNQIDWEAWADMADIAVNGYREYILDLFKKEKVK